MSYGAEICFKTLPAKDLFWFFQNLKAECGAKFEEIAKHEFFYMPSLQSQYKALDDYGKECIDRNWMRSNIFTFRYFYLPELELLGMFSIPDAVQHLFDKSIYFQNSADQDYDWEVWEGIGEFEIIAQKWRDVSNEVVFKHYRDHDGGFSDDETATFDYDYYRKTFCYDEIWEKIGRFLYHETLVVYLSLFGGYELYEAETFCKYCRDFYQEWRESLDRKVDETLKQDILEKAEN